jgi:hypothetical protein
MYSRVTLLEVDTLRVDMGDAVALFRDSVVPAVREHEGYEGALVLTTPEGKGMIVTLWATEEAAEASAAFATGELERYMTLFRAPPGRDHYEVAYAELPSVSVGEA